jgi:hypothetical protein
MNKDRLLQLADSLGSNNMLLERFDYNEILKTDSGSLEITFTQLWPRTKAEHACGTTGCAMGEARLMWPTQFYLNPDGWGDWTIKDDNGVETIHYGIFTAAANFFSITYEQALYLFDPAKKVGVRTSPLDEHATAHEVAEHIRNFVAKEGVIDAQEHYLL